jgi:PAS domain S-box-containing protein
MKFETDKVSIETVDEHYRSIYEYCGIGMVVIEEDTTIACVNFEFEKMTGFTKAGVEGKILFTELIEDPDVHEIFFQYHNLYKSEHRLPPNLCETKIRNNNGGVLDILIRETMLPNTTYSIVTMLDITEQKRLEAEYHKLEQKLFQSQKLDAIGTLAGGIAHDFNNILSGIVGYTELALDELNDPAEVKHNLKEVLSASERARDLVRQILTFSRHTETELKEITPKYIIKDAFKLLRATIPTTIEFNLQINSDSVILGDATQLHLVVVNLCTNAAYAMRDSMGVIEVHLEDINVDEEFIRFHSDLHKGKHLRLRLSDTGCGIKPEFLSRIFEPFFTTKAPGEGTGLGLSVVHGIVKNFNGIITVYSEVGRGTTFTIVLPVLARENSENVAEQQYDMPKGSETILLIDDEMPILDTVRSNLTNLGYSIVAFDDSLLALEAFKKDPQKYDLVITDFTMPHCTGIDVAIKIKETRKDIPIMLCSGFVHKGLEDEAQKTGIKEVLRKPIRTIEMANAIRHVLVKK